MKKAVIYARFSSNNQRDESIDAQVRACREYAKHNDLNVIHVYADRAKSGTTDQREEFQKMLKAAKNRGGFEIVLVHKLDRFSRDRLEAMLYKRELAISGVQLVSTLERLGDDPESALMESIYFGMAEFYSRNLAREVRKGMNENAIRGLHCGGMAPFGFQLNRDTHKLEINPDEAEGVRMAFDAYLAGCSYSEIARRLNDAGYHTHSGKAFTKGSLHDMFINEKYCGRWTYGKRTPKDVRKIRNHHAFNEDYTVIEGGCPEIVTKEIFEAVQIKMGSRKRGRRCDQKTDWKLSGLVRCGCCGQLLHTHTRTGRNKQLYHYYRCSTKDCPMTSIPKDILEDEVLQKLDDAISPETKKELAAKMIESLSNKPDTDAIVRKISDVDSKIGNLSKALADGAPWVALSAQWNELTEQKEQLQQQLLEESESGFYNIEDAVEFLGRFGSLCSMEYEEQVEILHRNVRRIILTPVQEKKFLWNLEIDIFPIDAPLDASGGAYGGPGSGVPAKRSAIVVSCRPFSIITSMYVNDPLWPHQRGSAQ